MEKWVRTEAGVVGIGVKKKFWQGAAIFQIRGWDIWDGENGEQGGNFPKKVR